MNLTGANPAPANFPPELALLLTMARTELRPADQDRLRALLAGGFHQEGLRLLSARHGLAQLLFHHLSRHAPGALAASSMQALREECRETTQRNLLLAARLIAVSRHLSLRGIPHASFKGPLLAERYYGSCSLRASHDIDILVPPEQTGAARSALAEIGFHDQYGFSQAQQEASFRFGFEHTFAAAQGVALDLHWRLVPRFVSRSMDLAGLWRRVRMARLLDGEVPTLAPEDELVALCLHAGQHEWAQLSHFCDLAQLLAAYPRLDWEIVRSHLGDSGTRHTVAVSLLLVSRHWQAALPAEMLRAAAADVHAPRLADRIAGTFWPLSGIIPEQPNLGWLLDRSAGEALADRLRLILGIVLGPTLDDFAVFRLPRPLHPLYPALRALRLTWKYSVGRRRS